MRKKKTTVKYQVTFVLPAGANLQQAQQFIRDAITAQESVGTNNMNNLDMETLRVALLKKEVEYG